ncbi:MAG TPA: tetratricopeptide repeat protein [Terracidiphilus sp.]|nr:tetratricopeptide repeat protein [Terracidiphilus sp.]
MRLRVSVVVAVLFAFAAVLTGHVFAGQTGSTQSQPQVTVEPEGMPPFLVPITMKAYSAPADPGLAIDVPVKGTIYPPDMIAPQFAWRDGNPAAKVWRIEIKFTGHARPVQAWSEGDGMQLAPLDTSLVGYVEPTLTPRQAAAHTWRPDDKTWELIKNNSVEREATVLITGYAGRGGKELSRGETTFKTSKDPVGAPIFYRDVPLLPPPPETEQRGVIKPLPDSVLPKIKWELRYVNQKQSKVIMTGLPTCANCHSFTRDGKTMGIDVDGPANDKGLYALIPIQKISTISDKYLIHWSAFSEENSQKRFGFMSQVSPDGRYVVNSIDVPHAHGVRVLDRLYNGFYSFYGFGQVFYPTRGVLAWYDTKTKKLAPLPGADDPDYVQTSAFWSPDGKYLVYSRAAARDPYPEGFKVSKYADDPNETQIQYDLYRIPFNNGKGGKPERIIGASENGMSNNFPKVSPDGKWIVYVECKNGLLMRPDSKLYIVPFNGGVARPLASNLPVMNSWHTWAPNGHWLAFSSKSPSFYTHLYLTHIDDQGNASPAIVVEDATASNRAVNIPEFLNIGPDGLEHIDTPAIDFYREFDAAQQLQDTKEYAKAIPAWKVAAAKDPTDARPYNNIGVALAALGHTDEAIENYRKALAIDNARSQTHNNLGSALAQAGRFKEATVEIQKAIDLDPDNGMAHINLGHVLEVMGDRREQAVEELNKGLELAPKSADGHNIYGVILARMGKLDEAITELQKAVRFAPRSAECHFNLGRAYAATSQFALALPQFQAASELTQNREPPILQMLAAMYSETGQYQKAVGTAQQALNLANQRQDADLARALQGNLERYQRQLQQSRATAPNPMP